MNHPKSFGIIVFVSMLSLWKAAHCELGSVIVAAIETEKNQRIELVSTKSPVSPKVNGKDALQYTALYLVDAKTENRTLLYQTPSVPQMANEAILGLADIRGLAGALMSKSAVEILMPGALASYDLLRFTMRDGQWKFVGHAKIHDTLHWLEKATLEDWGKIHIKQLTSGEEQVFTVEADGVVRVGGKPYVPQKTALGGTSDPETTYRSNYKSYVEEYNLPRDANGMTIWEDPVLARVKAKNLSSSRGTDKQPQSDGEKPKTGARTLTKASTKPGPSSYTLMIIGGVIVLGIVSLLYRLRKS